MTYTYKRTEPQLWTVGEYTPSGAWEPESDHGSAAEAAHRVSCLNGGGPLPPGPGEQRTYEDGYQAALREFADHLRGMANRGANERITEALLFVAELAEEKSSQGGSR